MSRRQRIASVSSVTEINNGIGMGNNRQEDKSSAVKDFLTMLALSFHAVFEGLAFGLEERKEDVWELFIGGCLNQTESLFNNKKMWFIFFQVSPLTNT